MTKKIELILSIICSLLASYIFTATLFQINTNDLKVISVWSLGFTIVLLIIMLSILIWLLKETYTLLNNKN